MYFIYKCFVGNVANWKHKHAPTRKVDTNNMMTHSLLTSNTCVRENDN